MGRPALSLRVRQLSVPLGRWPERRRVASPKSELSKGRLAKRHKSQCDRRGEQGFTLVEILVVITIIGLIMGLVGPRVLNYLSDAKVKAAKIQIESFASALDLYLLDTGRYPSTSEGLTVLVRRPGNVRSWSGPYLKGAVVPNDPWGHPYVYRMPGQHGPYDIISYGSDGAEGGTGTGTDIASWAR